MVVMVMVMVMVVVVMVMVMFDVLLSVTVLYMNAHSAHDSE